MAPEAKFTFTNVPSSEQIVFVCSDNTTRCKIHEHALLQRFPHMKRQIEEQRNANPDQDVELPFQGTKSEFEAFFQYIYTGTYDSPEPILVIRKAESKDLGWPRKPIAKCNTSNQNDSPKAAEQKKACNRCHDALCKSFRAELSSLKEQVPNGVHYSRPNTNPHESYENIFKWHVDIYLVSGMRFFSLATLAKYKLHQSLISFQLHDQRLVDIIRLLEYCYDKDRLFYEIRAIVAHYAAIHVDKLWKIGDFQTFVRSNGDFAGDLMDVLVNQRLFFESIMQ
ncbi:hypothetical protein J3459_009626 [Metarhizium acridum]|nr:hypothetical protein J3458_008746 [Metarhizium acridum]KAG8425759.1 hypothetical protein J3459_009703 [Metarhizium acridum]KAG8425794.1 hypothetical protein J3459_009626 [Metarhizium acridum]